MRPQRDTGSTGQRSVWDFPRPAIAEPCDAHIRIEHRGIVIAETREAVCTFETSHPPGYYIPPDAIAPGLLRRAEGSSFCEWKGAAVYWDVVIGGVVLPRVGWSYPNPSASFAALRDHIALLCRAGRSRHRERRDSAATARCLLRRLDYARLCRAVQGRAGQYGMVNTRDLAQGGVLLG